MLRLDRFLTLYCFNPVLSLSPAKSLSIPILMYHSICDEPESGHPYYWINTSLKRFTEHMQLLKENDFKVISLADAVEFPQSSLGESDKHTKGLSSKHFSTSFSTSGIRTNRHPVNPSSKYVVLTFDDGFHDYLESAWPVLSDFGFTATVFVPTDFIGNERKHFNGRACLTWGEVRSLHKQGVSFGSHTASHCKLYGLPWDEVRRELLVSRQRLEDELQATVSCFAYPYAFPQEDRIFVSRLKQELIDQGYRTAVTTVIGRAKHTSDPLFLERLPVNESDDAHLLNAKLAGQYDWVVNMQKAVRQLKRITRSRAVRGCGIDWDL